MNEIVTACTFFNGECSDSPPLRFVTSSGKVRAVALPTMDHGLQTSKTCPSRSQSNHHISQILLMHILNTFQIN